MPKVKIRTQQAPELLFDNELILRISVINSPCQLGLFRDASGAYAAYITELPCDVD